MPGLLDYQPPFTGLLSPVDVVKMRGILDFLGTEGARPRMGGAGGPRRGKAPPESKWRDEGFVGRYEVQQGYHPGTIRPVPPRMATVTPFPTPAKPSKGKSDTVARRLRAEAEAGTFGKANAKRVKKLPSKGEKLAEEGIRWSRADARGRDPTHNPNILSRYEKLTAREQIAFNTSVKRDMERRMDRPRDWTSEPQPMSRAEAVKAKGDQSPRNAQPLIDLKAWGKQQGWNAGRVDRAADIMWKQMQKMKVAPNINNMKMWMSIAQQKGLLE